MKKITLFLLTCFVFSCKKDHIDTNKVRLLKTEVTDSNGNKSGFNYEYDSYGRITKVSTYNGTQAPVTQASVTYSGNQAIMNVTDNSDAFYTNVITVIKMTLDADRKSLQRIKGVEKIRAVGGPMSVHEFHTDTLDYTYDAGGLLLQTKGRGIDSIWYVAGETQMSLHTTTGNYTNQNGNLTHIDEVAIYNKVTRNTSGTTLSSFNEQELTDYTYIQQYPNQTDLANTAILNEYKHYNYDAPLNRSYKNMPESSVLTSTLIDGSGTTTYHSDKTTVRTYNQYGFLSVVTSNLVPDHEMKYFYSK